MPSGPPEFIPPFITVTGMKCSYGKISSPLTDSLREHPVFSTLVSPRSYDWKYVYGSQASLPRSREPSQPALSCEHIENFTKDLEVRRDLGHRASPVNRAHMSRPSVSRSVSQSFVKSVSQSVSHSVSQPVSRLVSQSVRPSFSQSFGQSFTQSGVGTPYNGLMWRLRPKGTPFSGFRYMCGSEHL